VKKRAPRSAEAAAAGLLFEARQEIARGFGLGAGGAEQGGDDEQLAHVNLHE
jgi:hypothetical protein